MSLVRESRAGDRWLRKLDSFGGIEVGLVVAEVGLLVTEVRLLVAEVELVMAE